MEAQSANTLLKVPDMQAYAAHKFAPEQNLLNPHTENIHELLETPRSELKKQDFDRYKRYRKAWWEMKKNQWKMDKSEKHQAAFRLRAMINLDDEERAHVKNEKPTHLRKGQIPLHQKIAAHIGAKVIGENDGYCVLPTGVGKTVLFSNIIEQMMRGQRAKVCIVVPSIPLLNQVRQEILSRNSNIPIFTFGGGNTEQIEDNGIQIVTYQSLASISAKETYDVVILDEAHTATSDNRTGLAGEFTTALRLGFTATPDYNEEKNVKNILKKEIVNMSLVEAQREGMIAPFKIHHVHASADLSKLKQTNDGRYNDQELEKVLNTVAQNEAVAQTHESHFQTAEKSTERFVAFCCTLAHCDGLAHSFQKKGFRVVVHERAWLTEHGIAGTEEEQNAEVSRRLNLPASDPKSIHGVISARKLTAGWDEPIVSVCYNVTPTSSRVDIVQKSGRALRINPNDKKR